jgi:PAS domain S-box-containing protein
MGYSPYKVFPRNLWSSMRERHPKSQSIGPLHILANGKGSSHSKVAVLSHVEVPDARVRSFLDGEEKLSLSDNRDAFVSLADYIPQFVWICTPDGANIYFNERWVHYTGLSLEESSGAGWSTPFHPDDKQKAWDAWNRAVQTGTPYQVESRLRAADGTYRWFLMQGKALTTTSGEVDRWFGTCTDIEDLKRSEQALLKSEKLASMGRMAASIAHEINNPLEAVTNTLYLARTNLQDSQEVLKYLDLAESELKRIAHITRQTLGFYREMANPTVVSLNSVLDAVVDLLQGKIRVCHAEVQRRYEGELFVRAVPGELRQVFANLVANSLDAIAPGGRIILHLSTLKRKSGKPTHVRAAVADEGEGIPKAHRGSVFEALFTTKLATGSGLGLWVAKEIIEKHNGSIRIRSRSTGLRRGTIVSVLLPIDREPISNDRLQPNSIEGI